VSKALRAYSTAVGHLKRALSVAPLHVKAHIMLVATLLQQHQLLLRAVDAQGGCTSEERAEAAQIERATAQAVEDATQAVEELSKPRGVSHDTRYEEGEASHGWAPWASGRSAPTAAQCEGSEGGMQHHAPTLISQVSKVVIGMHDTAIIPRFLLLRRACFAQ
jgi:hypothetical protein